MNNLYKLTKNKKNNDIKEKKTEIKQKIKRQCIDKTKFINIINLIKFNELNSIKKFNLMLLNSLLYLTGCRISEILLLNKGNIEHLFNNFELDIFCPKTNTTRNVLINQDVADFIYKLFGVSKEEFFNNINEKGLINIHTAKLDKRTSYYWMDDYFKLLTNLYCNSVSGYKKDSGKLLYNFHSYRTNYINSLCRQCDNLDNVSRLIGHKNVYTTFIYWREIKVDNVNLKNNLSKALL
jgi:integrase